MQAEGVCDALKLSLIRLRTTAITLFSSFGIGGSLPHTSWRVTIEALAKFQGGSASSDDDEERDEADSVAVAVDPVCSVLMRLIWLLLGRSGLPSLPGTKYPLSWLCWWFHFFTCLLLAFRYY